MSELPAHATMRPVVEGLIRLDNGDVALLASECGGCRTRYFPAVVGCRNPDCEESALESVALPRSGRLYSFSWQSYRPPSLYAVDDWQPYAIGMVTLEPGLAVMARLDVPRERLRIDMPLELAGDVMTTDADGTTVGFVFRESGGA